MSDRWFCTTWGQGDSASLDQYAQKCRLLPVGFMRVSTWEPIGVAPCGDGPNGYTFAESAPSGIGHTVLWRCMIRKVARDV